MPALAGYYAFIPKLLLEDIVQRQNVGENARDLVVHSTKGSVGITEPMKGTRLFVNEDTNI